MALRELERRSHRLKYHLFMNGSSSESGSSDDDSVTLPSLLPRDTRRRCDSNNESDSEDQDDIPPLFSRQGYDSDDDNSDDSDSDSDEEMHDTSGYDADSGESDDDLDFEELMFFQTKRDIDDLLGSRYWAAREYRKSDGTVFKKHLEENDGCFFNDEEFKTHYRCSRDALQWITEQIEDHPVFNNARGRKQAPVKEQLMLLLHFLGEESVSNRSQRAVYWKSTGHCDKARERCVEAIRSLREKYVRWPGEQERKDIAIRIMQKYQIPNVVGIIDGTLLQLAFMPEADDKADYSGRKYPWSLSVMIVNDDRGCIRYWLGGYPGTAHDNRVWKKTRLYTNKEDFFSAIEFLLGDTAFEPSDIMVSCYKKLPEVPLPYDEVKFNKAMAKPWVRSEHSIGVWKCRFPWLRKIHMIITNDTELMVNILEYIECCVILHNMLLAYGDESPKD